MFTLDYICPNCQGEFEYDFSGFLTPYKCPYCESYLALDCDEIEGKLFGVCKVLFKWKPIKPDSFELLKFDDHQIAFINS